MAYLLPQGKVIVSPHAREQALARCQGHLGLVLESIAEAWKEDLRGRVAIVCGQRPIPVVKFRRHSCTVVTVLGHDYGINRETRVLQISPVRPGVQQRRLPAQCAN